jgi:hypothetical protein
MRRRRFGAIPAIRWKPSIGMFSSASTTQEQCETRFTAPVPSSLLLELRYNMALHPIRALDQVLGECPQLSAD